MGGTASRREEGFRHDKGCYKMGGVKLHPYYDTEVVANPQLQNCNEAIV